MKRRSNKSKTGVKPGKPAARQARREPTTPMSGRRRWLFRCIALLILPLLLLAGLELMLRLAGYGHDTGFFEKARIGGKDVLVNNENFSLRFFPPQLARAPGPVMMDVKKPANTYRIFVLGESAARGEPEPPYAASRYLQVLLNERYPDTHFEVFNLGITAIDSHVILPIARDCGKAGGDLWIIYMGNNEMVGPFGAATVFGAKSPPLGLVRLNLAIQTTRTGQLLADIGRRLKPKKSNTTWGGMEMFAGNQLHPDDARKEVVYQNFEQNLNDIVRAGLDSGANILLNTVAVNLKDCPPFASLINSNLPAADRALMDKLYAGACADEARSDFAAAAQAFEQAAKLDPQFAELQFRLAGCLLALTNFDGARAHFQTACDVDALPFRADSRINDAIRKTGRRFAGDRLNLFDAAAVLATNAGNSLCGQETFFEHVHFTFDGNYRLGLAWADQVEKMLPAGITHTARSNGWASQESCDRLLGLTDWNRHAVTEVMMERLQHPPLSDQLNNAGRLELLGAEEKRLRQRMTPAAAQTAAEVYQAAIQKAPQDHLLRENYAEFLEAVHDLKQAAAQWQQEQQLAPHDWEPFFQAGRLLAEFGQWEEAEASLKKALALRPRLADGWYQLGGVHLGTRKFESALEDYNRARELDPQKANYCAAAANALSKLGRHDEAIQLYREAARMEPDSWVIHFALGNELATAGRLSEAEAEFTQVIKQRPDVALAHLGRGVMLAKLGRLEEAAREFQETLRLEPGNQQAREYLKRINDGKSRQG